jgi:hypothetical protein
MCTTGSAAGCAEPSLVSVAVAITRPPPSLVIWRAEIYVIRLAALPAGRPAS